MGKTRDLFKKIRLNKRTFQSKMSTKKDRNTMDLKEAEDINKWWRAYIEELLKNDLNDPDSHSCVITQIGTDILECEIK